MYNLIAYRPNGDDTWGSRSDSDLIIRNCETVDELVHDIYGIKILEYATRKDRSYAAFKFTIFLDGKELSHWDIEPIENAADALMEKYEKLEKSREDKAAIEKLMIQQERQRNMEISQLLELKNKYPEVQ